MNIFFSDKNEKPSDESEGYRGCIINLLGNEYWLEPVYAVGRGEENYKPTGNVH